MDTPETATLREFAGIAGFKPQYAHELKKTGRLVLTDNGKRVRVAESLLLIADTKDPAKAGVAARHAATRAAVAALPESPEDEADDPVTGGDAKRRAKALADKAEWDAKVAERDYRVSIGKLLDADQVESATAAAGVAIRTALERMVDVMAPQVAAQSDEVKCRSLLWDEVAHTLEDMSRTFRALAKVEA